jgi:hypothetical protein
MAVTSKTRRIRNERYYARKAAGICTYGSTADCPHPPAEDSSLCERHLADARDRVKRSDARLHAERRNRGRCAYCGKVKSETYACAGCQIRRGHSSTRNTNNNTDNTMRGLSRSGHERRGADSQWREETHNGKTSLRYVGQARRGVPSTSVLDEHDCKQIVAEVQRAMSGLAYAHALPAELPRSQRKDAVRAALSRLALARRFIDETLERHKYEP